MNQEPTVPSFDEFGTSFDGMSNFLMYTEQSKNTKARTVFPTGERVVNRNAKPFKLDPPK